MRTVHEPTHTPFIDQMLGYGRQTRNSGNGQDPAMCQKRNPLERECQHDLQHRHRQGHGNSSRDDTSTTCRPMPEFAAGIRRAPARHFNLSRQDTRLALKNALRYIPEKWQPELAPEFLNELLTTGRVYGYRFRPPGRIHGRPVDRLPRRLHRGPGLPGDDRQQPRLRGGPLPLRAGDLRRDRPGLPELDAVPADQALPRGADPRADPGHGLRPSLGSLHLLTRGPAGDHHQRPDGGLLRRPGQLAPRRGAGGGQLRADDGRRLDVHRAAGHRPRHLQHAPERRPRQAGHPGGPGPRRAAVRVLRPGRHERRPGQGDRDRRRGRHHRRGGRVADQDPGRPGLDRPGDRSPAEAFAAARERQRRNRAGPSPFTATWSTCWNTPSTTRSPSTCFPTRPPATPSTRAATAPRGSASRSAPPC